MLIAAALGGYPLFYAGDLLPLAGVLAAVGIAAVGAAGVWPRGAVVSCALLVLSAEYVSVEVLGGVRPVSTVPYAVGLFVLAEVLLFGLRLPSQARVDQGIVVYWLLRVLGFAFGSAGIGAIVLIASGLEAWGIVTGALLGGGALVAVGILPLWLVRKAIRGAGAGRSS